MKVPGHDPWRWIVGFLRETDRLRWPAILVSMYLRSVLQRSVAARVLLLLLIAVFFAVCGLHLAAAHHDGGADGLAFGETLILIALLSIILVGLRVRRTPYASLSTSVDSSEHRSFIDIQIAHPSEESNAFLPLLI